MGRNLFNVIKENILSLLVYTLSHWKRWVAMIIIFIVSIFSLLKFSENNSTSNDLDMTQIYILGISLESWGTWFAIVGIPCTAFWAMFQYDKKTALSQQEKAAKIADEFSKDIVQKMYIISSVLIECKEFSDMLKLINPNSLSRFDWIEISEITGIKEQEELMKFFQKMNDILFSPEIQKIYEKKLEERYGEDYLNNNLDFPCKYNVLVENTLNRLEYLCMNISSNAAGSKYLYSSLHQIFLNTIHILSIIISLKNNDNVDSYYINVITVYNMWNKEKQKDVKKLYKTKDKVTKLNNKAKEEIKKLEEKADKEVKKLLHKKTETV